MGTTGDGKSAEATPDGKSRKKKMEYVVHGSKNQNDSE